jgi:type I restriction enzyme R subunit
LIFNEADIVEAFIRDRLTGTSGPATVTTGVARQDGAIYGLGCHFVGPADLPRQSQKASF